MTEYKTIEACEDRIVELHTEAARVQQSAQVKQARLSRKWAAILQKNRLTQQFEEITQQKRAIAEKLTEQIKALADESTKLTARIAELSEGNAEPVDIDGPGDATDEEPMTKLAEFDVETDDLLSDADEPLWKKLRTAEVLAAENGVNKDRMVSLVVGGKSPAEALDTLTNERVVPIKK